MNLFGSVLSEHDHQQPDSPEFTPSAVSSWSFGGLIKTLATKSESVIGSYRRDFEEFGSELKKETSIIRQVASRAVMELPDSLEIGASVAQESLESVGQAIDDIGATVWKSTAKIISHGRESLLSSSEDSDPDSSGISNQALSVKPYSRFETQLLAIQSDKGTYVREPDDLYEFEKWNLEFKLDEKSSEIIDLINENKAVKEMYEEIVPVEVDANTFWSRYFYKVYKLKQAEEARVRLVKRAISGEEEEDLSWDLDDEGDETSGSSLNPVSEGKSSIIDENSKEDEARKAGKEQEKDSENVLLVEKADSTDISSKDSDISVISTQPSLPEVEDLGWDHIEEDIRSNEDRSLEATKGNEEKSDWRKRVSAKEEDEELTWEIEDDDDSKSLSKQ